MTVLDETIDRLEKMYARSAYADVGKTLEDLRALRELFYEDGQGIIGVWVCDRCGQPMPRDGVCESGLHIGPVEGYTGRARLTTDLVPNANDCAETVRTLAYVHCRDDGTAYHAFRHVADRIDPTQWVDPERPPY